MRVAGPVLQSPRRVGDIRLFASARDEPRSRRLVDIVSALAAILLLAILAWYAQPTRAWERELVEATSSWPEWLVTLWVVAYDVVLLLAVGVLVAAAVRSRWPLVLAGVTSAVSAVGLVLVVARQTTDAWPSLGEAVGRGDGVAWPAAGLALASAVLLAVSADVTAPARTWGGRALGVGAVAAVMAGRTTLTGALAALVAASAAAAIARLVVGTAAGHLSRREVLALLDALGVHDVAIDRFARQDDGVVLVEGRGPQGERLLVKVLGRDVAERRRAHQLWRSLIYRDGGASFAAARRPGLDRETLATLLADARGVPVWGVLTAGRAGGVGEALVLVLDGERVSDAKPGTFDRDSATAAWRAVEALHGARIAHLNLGPHAIATRNDGTVALTAFTDAVLAATDERIATDDAQLLVTVAILLGPDCAVASARAALDDAALAGLLPYLQRPALPHSLRAAAKASKLDVDALRKAVAEVAGVPEPELAKLQRVTPAGLLSTGLLLLAAAAIVPFLTGLDRDQLADAFRTASIPLVVAGFVVAQAPRVAQAVSTLGSVPARLPFLPVYLMQLATSFMNIALPSAAARMALNVRFFQRQGLPPATAVMSGLLDSFIGNVVQALLLVALLLFSSTSLDLGASESTTSSDSDSHALVALIVLAVVAGVVAMVAIRRLRRALVGHVRAWWPDVKAAAGPLHHRRNVAQLLGGNIACELLFASALALFVYAFGGEITIVEALFVNMTASLLVMFVPVPGGIGITESALIVGLTSFDIGEDVAFAAVISYRLSTFYLPPIWGWFAMRWLNKNGYV